MNFEPKPDNDFAAFSSMYYERCRAQIPQVVGSAAKWRFEDLIPGLSDFDTRLFYADGMTAADWSDASLAIGWVHTQMAEEFPHWARNLEHLPGLNLTIAEVTAPELFYPEFQQWTFYHGDEAVLASMRDAISAHEWDDADEAYQLKKVATFFGRYNRTIDPPVNLGPFENKYPLHSRFMHYFTPCVQAMASLKLKHNVHGKLESLRLASEHFPQPQVIDRLFESLDRHYECPALYQEPQLSQLEDDLENYLNAAWSTLDGELNQVRVGADDNRGAIARKVATIPADPVETFFGGTRFARQMKGRLLFFSQDIPWFDSQWLIQIELGRIVKMLFDIPMRIMGELRYKLPSDTDPQQILTRLEGDLLDIELCNGMRRFVEVASRPVGRGQEKAAARAVASCCDPVLQVIAILGDVVARHAAERSRP